jgi:hypothetical protein
MRGYRGLSAQNVCCTTSQWKKKKTKRTRNRKSFSVLLAGKRRVYLIGASHEQDILAGSSLLHGRAL